MNISNQYIRGLEKTMLVFFLFFFASVQLIFFYFYRPSFSGDMSLIYGVFLATCTGVFLMNLVRNDLKILNALNLIVVIYLLNFCFRAMYIVKMNYSYLFKRLGMRPNHFYGYIYKGIIVALISLTFIIIGYVIFKKNNRITIPQFKNKDFYVKLNYFLIFTGIFIWILFLVLSGGFDFLFNILKNPYEVRSGAIVLRFGFLRWGNLICAVFVFANIAIKKKITKPDMLIILFYGFMMYTFGLSVSAPLLFFLGVLIVYDIAVKRIKLWKIIGVGLLLFLMIAVLKMRLNYSYRELNRPDLPPLTLSSITDAMERIPLRALGSSNFAGMDVLSMLLRYFPAKLDFIQGRSLVDAIVKVIPFVGRRTVGSWLNKVLFDTRNKGNNPTLPGIFYINFGIPGVVLFSFLFGWFCAGIENRLSRQPSLINILLYVVTLVFFVLFITRTGAFAYTLKRYVYLLGGLLFYYVSTSLIIRKTNAIPIQKTPDTYKPVPVERNT